MPFEIEFRRHSVKDGPNKQMIGQFGYRLARLYGERELRGSKFTHFFVSSLWRTHQTLVAFAEGAGDFNLVHSPPFSPIYVVSPEVKSMWQACRQAEKQSKDMVAAAFAFDQAQAEKVAAETAEMFRAWVKEFPDGANVLVVGHSPSLELMAYGLTGMKIAGLGECEGFRLSCPNLDLTELRNPFDQK